MSDIHGAMRCAATPLAAFLLMAAAPEANRPTQTVQKASASVVRDDKKLALKGVSAPKSPEISKLDRPCAPGIDARSSDLCAQWKAADAASMAALWAMIGTIVAALGTAGLYWQISLTRKAVMDTAAATAAMREANQIARRASISQERAWLVIESIDSSKLRYRFEGARIVIFGDVAFRLQNTGRSAASDIWTQSVAGEATNIWNRIDETAASPLYNEFLPPGGFTDVSTDVYVVFEPVDKKEVLEPLRAGISIKYNGGGDDPFLTECLWVIAAWSDGETGWQASDFNGYFGKSIGMSNSAVFGYHRRVT